MNLPARAALTTTGVISCATGGLLLGLAAPAGDTPATITAALVILVGAAVTGYGLNGGEDHDHRPRH